jgi:hypothetical protein
MTRIYFAGIIATIIALWSQIAYGASLWDTLAEQPGARVSDTKDSFNGDEIRNVELPSAVVIQLRRHGGQISSSGVDYTGHGAVLCSWGIYVSLRSILKVCSPGNEALKTGLDAAIDRINGFIIENSLAPVSKADLEKDIQVAEQGAIHAMTGASDEETKKKCMSEPFFAGLKSMGPERLDRDVTDLLSVRRPPVQIPCL